MSTHHRTRILELSLIRDTLHLLCHDSCVGPSLLQREGALCGSGCEYGR